MFFADRQSSANSPRSERYPMSRGASTVRAFDGL